MGRQCKGIVNIQQDYIELMIIWKAWAHTQIMVIVRKRGEPAKDPKGCE